MTPVCDTTQNATPLGAAQSEAAAIAILRRHLAEVYPIVGAKRAQCMLMRPDAAGERMVEAWIPVTEPNDVLAAIGRALYRDRWQAQLARDVGVNENTIGRWLTGKTPLPAGHGIFHDLLTRLDEVCAARDALAEWINLPSS